MPDTYWKNELYRLLLPVLVPDRPFDWTVSGHALQDERAWQGLMRRHRVQGGVLLLADGKDCSLTCQSIRHPGYDTVGPDSLFRVASITKMAVALVLLKLCEQQRISLDSSLWELLPQTKPFAFLEPVSLRMLLSHTSGLRDVPAYERALSQNQSWESVLQADGVFDPPAGERFAYCNFGFGLLGCVIEQVTGQNIAQAMDELLFQPMGMHATLDASGLTEDSIVGIRRIISRYGITAPMKKTALDRTRLEEPDPMHHFGHTAGAMYADARAIERLLQMISGQMDYLSAASLKEMHRRHASYGRSDSRLRYGLGLLEVNDPIAGHAYGHQGYAYGCVDGAFYQPETGRIALLLDGGASEAREGRMGRINQDLIRLAFGKELPAWTKSQR